MRTLDISVQDRGSRTAADWLWPLLPIGAAVFCLSALIYFHVQYDVVQVKSAMQVLVAAIYKTIGFAPAVMFFLLLLTWSSIWFVTGRLERPLMRVARLVAMAVMLGVFLNLGDGGVSAAAHKGELGAWLAGCLVGAFGYFPSIVLVWAVTFASLLLATDFFFSDSFERLRLRPRTDVGVETAVTDHLRGLGAATAMAGSAPHATSPRSGPVVPPQPRAADLQPLDPLPLAPELDFLRELGQGGDAAVAELPAEPETADVAAEPEPDYGPRRRRSYFERRREEEAAAAVEPEVADRGAELDVAAAAEWAPAEDDAIALAPLAPADAAATRESGAVAEVAPGGASVDGIDATGIDDERAVAGDVDVIDDLDGDDDLDAELDDEADEVDAVEEADELAIEDESVSAAEAMALGGADLMADIEPGRAPEVPPEPFAVPAPAADTASSSDLAAQQPPEPTYVPIEPVADADDESEGDDGVSTGAESVVAIPRPEAPRERSVASAPRSTSAGGRRDEGGARQQKLFGAAVDEELMGEATELARGQSRVTAALLQRRLRIDYQQALEVLGELGARGVVELDADASQGRVVV